LMNDFADLIDGGEVVMIGMFIGTVILTSTWR
jgi:hypothetical protein